MVSTILAMDIEKWWKHLDCPMKIMESIANIHIGDCTFRPWAAKHCYKQKTKYTYTYMRTFQCLDGVLNNKGEIVYPILDVYVDICEGTKRTTYKKVRCHCSC